ncbi:MAG: lysophospholipid acyltransferase family protein [Bradymonadia bacterium]
MIPARKGPRFNRWFSKQAEGRIHKTFGRVYSRGLDGFEAASREGPILLVSNHSAWWDSMLIIWLVNRPLSLDGYAMMDAKNLRKFPFLGKVGAYGVELDQSGDGPEAIAYGADLLDRPGRMVLVYPQGRERPLNVRPLGFRRGAAVMAAQVVAAGGPPLQVVSLGARYVFGPREAPDVYLAFGPAVTPAVGLDEASIEQERRRQEDGVAEQLDLIEGALEAPAAAGFDTLYARKPGAVAQWAERTLVKAVRGHLKWKGQAIAAPKDQS